MESGDESGLLLYEPFYGLGEKPFSLSTDPRFLFKSASHAPVFQAVLSGIRRREGLVVLTGEIGMGKTTLCRSVLAALDRKTFAAFVPDPFVSREDLLKILLVEFGVVSVDDLVRGRLQGASRAELSYPLYEFLRSLEPLDAFAVLLIDEAQNLPSSLLEEVRILADLEGTRKLLQVVLIGQPELSSALQQPHMRQVKQRVTTHCELQPLDHEGVYGYVGHRLTVAGASAERLQFTGEALDLVFDASGGVPRVVNRLCDQTLQRGHQSRAARIGPELVRAAMADLALTVPVPVAEAPAARPAAPGAVPPRQVARPRPRGAASRHSESRSAAAMAALLLLGGLSGLTLAAYWTWAKPLLTQRLALPALTRPSMRIAAPLPAVLPPAIEALGEVIAPPQVPEASDDEPPDADAGPPRPVNVAQPVWVVQVGAFADNARAASLVRQLAGRGFTAFTSASTMRNRTLLHVVLVGPYASRSAAAAALDRIEEMPGIGQPILQAVPPAFAARH
jgi:type II secretory pathway predicted ATPase ExeA/cell division septation protein DedD